MRIVGWHLVRLINEAASELVGTFVEAIRSEPESGRLLFVLEGRRRRYWLIVCTRGDRQAFFWASDKTEIPAYESYRSTEKFNRLKRCRLSQVSTPQPDRVVHLSLDRPDQPATAGEMLSLDLWITWTGAAGNIWLVQPTDGVVLETFWQTESQTKNAGFSPPTPRSLLNWQIMTFPEYERERASCRDLALSDFMQKRFWGIDSPLARMIEEEATPFSDRPDQLWREFSTALNLLRHAVDPQTAVLIVRSEEIIPVLGTVTREDHEQVPSLSAALAALDARSCEERGRVGIIAQLRGELEKRIRGLQHRIAAINRAITDGEKAAQLRRQADLLGAQRDRLRPGMSEISIEDWESGEEITIRLDPAFRPQENIDAMYRRASKVTHASQNAQSALPQLVHGLGLWEARLKYLDKPSISTEELNALCTSCGLSTSDRQPTKHQAPKRLPYREFRMGSEVVWVGRSSRDNDQLTLKVACPDDLFLHASQSGGAHVILKRESKSREFNHETIVAAAQVAAFFSKAKHSHLVPVIYTEVRHVRKPRKAPPGLVQVTKEKSVMARPLPPPGYHESGYKE